MEIKATLEKPYTEDERINFIVEQNHNKGYEIRETEKSLEAWGQTSEEKKKEEKQNRIIEIKNLLNEIDLKSIRAIRSNDKEYLEKYEKEAQELREELHKLEEEIK